MSHIASYRGCPVYKAAVKAEKERQLACRKNENIINNSSINSNTNISNISNNAINANINNATDNVNNNVNANNNINANSNNNNANDNINVNFNANANNCVNNNVSRNYDNNANVNDNASIFPNDINMHLHAPSSQVQAESLVSALSVCIQMLVETIKEAVVNGRSLGDTESRSLAKTCVDALVGKQTTTWRNKVAAERSANIVWTPPPCAYPPLSTPSARTNNHAC